MKRCKGNDTPYARTAQTGHYPRNPHEGWEREKNARAAQAGEKFHRNNDVRPVSARIEWMNLHGGRAPLDHPTEKTKQNRRKRITLSSVWR